MKKLLSILLTLSLMLSGFSLTKAEVATETTTEPMAEATDAVTESTEEKAEGEASAEAKQETSEPNATDDEDEDMTFRTSGLLYHDGTFFVSSSLGFGTYDLSTNTFNPIKKGFARYVFLNNGKVITQMDGEFFAYNPETKELEKSDFSFGVDEEKYYVQKIINTSTSPVLYLTDNDTASGVIKWMNDGTEVKLDDALFLDNFVLKDDNTLYATDYNRLYEISKTGMNKVQAPSEDTFTEVENLFFNPVTQSLCYIAGNFVYQFDDKWNATRIGYVPFSPTYGAAIVADGKYFYALAINMDEDERIISIDLANLKLPSDVVTVVGLDLDKANNYNEKNPDLPIAVISLSDFDVFGNATALANHMKGSNAGDIYYLTTPGVSAALEKHNYLAPLDENSALMANQARLYPYLQNATIYEGKTYLVPTSIMPASQTITINTKAVEDVGLDPNVKTYMDFINLLKEAEHAIDGTEYKLFNFPMFVKEFVSSNILMEYYARCLKNNEPIKFNSPEMIQLLTAINDTKFDTLPDISEEMSSMSYDGDDKESLFGLGFSLKNDEQAKQKNLYLSIFENQNPTISTIADFLAINALSKNKEGAYAVLERLLKTLPEEDQTFLYADVNTPILDKGRVKYIESSKKRLAKKEAELEKLTEESEKKALMQDIDELKKEIANDEANSYALTEQNISDYNNLVGDMYVLNSQLISYKNEQQQQLLQRFVLKQIDVATFLNEFDRIVNMAILEEN